MSSLFQIACPSCGFKGWYEPQVNKLYTCASCRRTFTGTEEGSGLALSFGYEYYNDSVLLEEVSFDDILQSVKKNSNSYLITALTALKNPRELEKIHASYAINRAVELLSMEDLPENNVLAVPLGNDPLFSIHKIPCASSGPNEIVEGVFFVPFLFRKYRERKKTHIFSRESVKIIFPVRFRIEKNPSYVNEWWQSELSKFIIPQEDNVNYNKESLSSYLESAIPDSFHKVSKDPHERLYGKQDSSEAANNTLWQIMIGVIVGNAFTNSLKDIFRRRT